MKKTFKDYAAECAVMIAWLTVVSLLAAWLGESVWRGATIALMAFAVMDWGDKRLARRAQDRRLAEALARATAGRSDLGK